jgi:gamma-glutamyltranspeptidase / glutathione hydrolase
MRKLTAFLVLCLSSFAAVTAQSRGETVAGKGITVSNGMVVSASQQASETGAAILRKGGNAVDAAVATGFALAVTYPEAGNIGGGGFMLIRMADGRSEVLDYREKAPLASSRDMYLDKSGTVIDGLSTATHLASGVPGSVDGMVEAHRKYGRLPFRTVIQPAIDLAEKGFPLSAGQAASLNSARETFKKRNSKTTSFVAVNQWIEGDIFRQPELAATLRAIRDRGRNGFYSGPVADMIIKEMKRGNGIISLADLAGYRSVWRKPLTGSFMGFDILTVPPPSGGGITLLQIFKMLETKGISSCGFHSPEGMHLIIEAERRAFADRSFFAGDADFTDVPVEKLTDAGYLGERMKNFDPEKATQSKDIVHGDPENPVPEETTHYSVVDSADNAVSVTTTLNGGFGSCIVVEGAGFLLNNEMDDFSVKPGFPNMYGLTGGEANSIKPGKRILSSMTPTIVTEKGRLFLVAGSPGGSTIPTTVLQVILNIVLYKMPVQEAVDAPRFHHQWLPDVVYLEKEFPDTLATAKLEMMGHRLSSRGAIGSVNAIMKMNNGSIQGGADRRGNNIAAGY